MAPRGDAEAGAAAGEIPVIHAVTDDEIVLRPDFPALAESVMAALAGRGAVHLRARSVPARRLYELAAWLAGLERTTGCWLVVNDRADVACAAGVQAVQLTSRSMAPADARRVGPHLRVGVSVHSPEAAADAARSGADWCVAGPVFPTTSHPGRDGGGPALIGSVAAAARIPVIGIGGITAERVAEVLAAGAHGVAAISGIWRGGDPGEQARRYLSKYDEHEGLS